MADISITLEGDAIRLSFQKDDQATAVLMDAAAARSLVSVMSRLLELLGSEDPERLEGEEGEEGDDGEADIEVLEVTSPSIDIGLDEEGQPILGLQAGLLPPFLLRLSDDEARHVAESLLEIVNAPRDARVSQGGH